MVAFDVSSIRSFDNVVRWLKDIETYAKESVPVILVANKVDV